MLRELYPDSPYTESLIQRNLERNFRQQQQRQQANRRRGPPMKGSKSDSGLGDSTEGERLIFLLFLVFLLLFSEVC